MYLEAGSGRGCLLTVISVEPGSVNYGPEYYLDLTAEIKDSRIRVEW